MYTLGKSIALLSVTMIFAAASFSQNVNTVSTAVPFLIVSGDARADGMGGVGIALTPDANGSQLNGARMAFIQSDFGGGLSFTPWVRTLVNYNYLGNFNAFYKIKDVQTIHTSLRYLSAGNVDFTSYTQAHPNQIFYDAGYARKLNDIVSIDATVRFIYASNLPNASTNTEAVKPGLAGAADISAFVDKTWMEKGNADRGHELLWGICISNIGSKMNYTSNVTKDFLPANLGIGFGYKLHLDSKDKHTIGVYADLNKLLVPTPNQPVGGSSSAPNGYLYSNSQANESSFAGIITSFYDAPGGARQEFKSITEQIGAEYWYKKMLAFRAGFFDGDPAMRGREFVTVGTGFRYSVAALHFSYNIPVDRIHNSLDNSFSLSLAFEFKKGILKKKHARTI